MAEINYRKLRSDETDLIVNYRIAFLRELQGRQTEEKEIILRKYLTEYFQKALKDNTFIGWVAESDSKPVGFGGMVVQQIPGHFGILSGRVGYILNMYTIPGYRNKGIGSGIIDRFIEDGKQLGLSKVYLHASNDGITLYRKKGFIEADMPELEFKL